MVTTTTTQRQQPQPSRRRLRRFTDEDDAVLAIIRATLGESEPATPQVDFYDYACGLLDGRFRR
jgi:hypothetical protein